MTLLTAVGFANVRVEALTEICAAEATPIGHQARAVLIAHWKDILLAGASQVGGELGKEEKGKGY